MEPGRLRVLIAGGGVAGLEAMLALRALAGERVAVTLLDPAADFVARAASVAELFGAPPAPRHPLGALARDAGAVHVRDALAAVDAPAREVRTAGGRRLSYDALVLALGAEERPAFAGALTFDARRPGTVTGLLDDVRRGAVGGLAVVVPPGPHWTLPAYELALLFADEAPAGATRVTVVVPEPEPLGVFGPAVSAAVRDELARGGVALEAGSFAELPAGPVRELVLHPGGRELAVDRVVALPRLRPRAIPGVGDDFLRVDGFGRVRGLPGVYAVGDGASFPVKHGALAAQQAAAAATHLAAQAGADVRPEPFRPVLRGRLLTAAGDRWLRRDPEREPLGRVAGHALWWPEAKVAGPRLALALAAADPAQAGEVPAPPEGDDVEVLVAAHP